MVKMVPVDRARHAGKRWRRPEGYAFAAADAIVPIGGLEFPQVALAMPIAFVEQSGRFVPVAVMALAQGINLFIGPKGQWLGPYVPAVLRAYPFLLGRPEGTEQTTLYIDEDSGLIVDEEAENVEKFFETDGTPSPAINEITNMLLQVEQDQAVAQLAVTALAEAGIIKPWPLTVPVGGQQVVVDGLFRIDEAALNALDDATFLKLRKMFALLIAYGQLLSIGQVGRTLAQLSLMRERIGLMPGAPQPT